MLDHYDNRVNQVRDAISGNIGTATIARVRTNLVRYMLQGTSFTWSVLKHLGFKTPPQDVTGTDVLYQHQP